MKVLDLQTNILCCVKTCIYFFQMLKRTPDEPKREIENIPIIGTDPKRIKCVYKFIIELGGFFFN